MITRKELIDRDRSDPLAGFYHEFELPAGVVYLDGNSLGALPKVARERVQSVITNEWGRDLIRSWTLNDWIDLPRQTGDKIARLIGADAGEVIVADSTSINVFKMVAAALRCRPDRRVILSEPGNFPTDLYMCQGLVGMLGQGYRLDLQDPDAFDWSAAAAADVAVVLLTHINYKTGRMHDMREITRRAHAAGALVVWDLAHSAGAVPLALNDCDVDLAVGCGYKYLNGGPGAPAFLFVAKRLQEDIQPPLSGWLGHARPFDFAVDYRPKTGIERNLCGTPAILSMAALDAALDVFLRVDMAMLRTKSVALTDLFIALLQQECGEFGFAVLSPEAAIRGSQVSIAHDSAHAIVKALIELHDVIGDFREPNVMRFGFAPLYLRYTDVWDGVAKLRETMESGAWDRPEFHARAAVT